MNDELDDNYLNSTYDKFFERQQKVLADVKNGIGNEVRKEKEFNYLMKISLTILKYKNYLKKIKDLEEDD